MLLKFWRDIVLWKKVTIGLVLGIIAGAVFGEKVANLGLLGEIFIRLVKMIMVPLIYVSIVLAITNMEDSKSLSRMTFKSVIFFVCTTCFAICIGIGVGYFCKPGVGVDLSTMKANFSGILPADKTPLSVVKLVREVIPDNALGAIVTGNLLQVIFFAFFTGFTVNLLNNEKSTIIKGFTIARNIVFKMIDLVLDVAPFGAFGFTAAVVGTQGLNVLSGMIMLVLVFLLGVVIQYVLFGIFISLSGLSPFIFYRKSVGYQMIAFSTSSSKATLPTTMRICSEKMGISKISSSFVLPLGAVINMDGTAVYLGTCSLFFAQVYGISLSGIDYLLIILASTLGSIGAAGIPGGGMMMLPMVLSTVNVPIEGIAFIAGIERVLDIFRTVLNITGDAAITLLVDKTEGTLDENVYNSK